MESRKMGLCYAKILLAGLFCAALLLANCQGRGSPSVTGDFDGIRAYAHVEAQVAFGPRPVGSEALAQTTEYIESCLQSLGWSTWEEVTDFRGTPIRNVLATKERTDASSTAPLIMLGAHYDTRPHADRDPDLSRRLEPILGANDGASGVAVLLEIARVYEPSRSGVNVVLAFFDGEDKGNIDGWPFSVGAEAVAQTWADKLSAMILVDMVGDAEQRLPYEGSSDETLRRDIWVIAEQLGYSEWFIPEPGISLIDDHVPFLRRGVPAVDIIDFDYPYWHTLADTTDKVSPDSLQRVGHVLLEYLYTRR